MKRETYKARLEKKSRSQLLKDAAKIVHERVRERDACRRCISCNGWHKLEAGHFYKAGSYSGLRFNALNIHGQCVSCNSHKSGNENEYRSGLIGRYGQWIVDELDMLAGMARQEGARKELDRFTLIDIIMRHKYEALPQITKDMVRVGMG